MLREFVKIHTMEIDKIQHFVAVFLIHFLMFLFLLLFLLSRHTPTPPSRPVFLHLQFENATDAWMAHDMLMRALDELNRNSLVLTRKVLWRARATLGARKLISVNLSWIKSQWYKEWFFRASKYLERKEDQAAIQQQVSEDDLRLQQLHQTKPQPQAPPRTANPQWHDELNSIDIDAVQEEIEQRAAKRSQSRRGGASAADATKGSDSSATSAKGKTGSKTDTTAASPRSGAKKRVANQPPRLIQTAKGSSSPSTTTSRSTSAVENTLSSLIKVTAAYSDTERLQSEASNGLGGSASTVDIKVKKFMFASAKSAAVAGGARAKKATIASRASAAEKKAPLSAAANKSAKSNSTATSGKAAARSRTPGKATKAAAGSVDKTTVAPSRARARAKAKSAPATSEK